MMIGFRMKKVRMNIERMIAPATPLFMLLESAILFYGSFTYKFVVGEGKLFKSQNVTYCDMVKASGAKIDFEDLNLKDGFIDHISVRAIFPKKKRTVRKERSCSVRVDSDLLVEVERFISRSENRFRYLNRKQFVDLAVAEFLRAEKMDI